MPRSMLFLQTHLREGKIEIVFRRAGGQIRSRIIRRHLAVIERRRAVGLIFRSRQTGQRRAWANVVIRHHRVDHVVSAALRHVAIDARLFRSVPPGSNRCIERCAVALTAYAVVVLRGCTRNCRGFVIRGVGVVTGDALQLAAAFQEALGHAHPVNRIHNLKAILVRRGFSLVEEQQKIGQRLAGLI